MKLKKSQSLDRPNQVFNFLEQHIVNRRSFKDRSTQNCQIFSGNLLKVLENLIVFDDVKVLCDDFTFCGILLLLLLLLFILILLLLLLLLLLLKQQQKYIEDWAEIERKRKK